MLCWPWVGGRCGEDPGVLHFPMQPPAHRRISVNSPSHPHLSMPPVSFWAQMWNQDGCGGRHGSQLTLWAFFAAGHSWGQTAWKLHPTSHWWSAGVSLPGPQKVSFHLCSKLIQVGPLLLCRMGRAQEWGPLHPAMMPETPGRQGSHPHGIWTCLPVPSLPPTLVPLVGEGTLKRREVGKAMLQPDPVSALGPSTKAKPKTKEWKGTLRG